MLAREPRLDPRTQHGDDGPVIRFAIAAGLALGVLGLHAPAVVADIPDDAVVTVTGQLLTPGGLPASGVKVVLSPVLTFREDALGSLGLVGSVGTVCLLDPPPLLCAEDPGTTTDEQGAYTFRMRGRDAKTSAPAGRPRDFIVHASLPAATGQLAGPAVSSRFTVSTPGVTVAPIRFWGPLTLPVQAGAQRLRVRWQPPVIPRSARRRATLLRFVTRLNEDVWAQPAARGATIDARALEDAEGALLATSVVTIDGRDTTFTGAREPFAGRAGAAPSRGMSCRGRGGTHAFGAGPCPVTDGAFDISSQGCPGSGAAFSRCHRSIAVDLGRRASVGRVFLHDLDLFAEHGIVETSNDARSWKRGARFARDDGTFVKLRLAPGIKARHLRLRASGSHGRISGLAELSVWPGPVG